ncbi:MAG: hypothetical protein MZV70_69245 [Desulfobacterales bacterium]|nr:hypothetical protein [Desulfobacterales bacterium]
MPALDLEDNLRRGVAAFEEAARQGANIIAFSELAFLASSFPRSRPPAGPVTPPRSPRRSPAL